MNLFVLNTLLALGWAALVGSFTLPSLLLGFGIGYVALLVARPLFGNTTYFERVWRVLRLALLFVYELVVSSLRVVWDVITPTHLSRPGIIAMPLDAEGEGQVLLVANLISLTPGSLSIDVSADRRTLYVHAMFVDDPDALRKELKDGLERRVIEAVK
ncbi:MAG: Na+/H+ antiporter subunit E [Alphaproteobacteria bacterium]|nr:Na+/H+ antiporter subunit E [Alphaproteobacteria bacterium]